MTRLVPILKVGFLSSKPSNTLTPFFAFYCPALSRLFCSNVLEVLIHSFFPVPSWSFFSPIHNPQIHSCIPSFKAIIMHSSTSIMRLGAGLVAAASTANAAYAIQDTYDTSNFFNEFTFFTGADPTAGFVDYLSQADADSAGLAATQDPSGNSGVYMGVDSTTSNPSSGRASVRVSSNNVYTHG